MTNFAYRPPPADSGHDVDHRSRNDTSGLEDAARFEREQVRVLAGIEAGVPRELLEVGVERVRRDLVTIESYLKALDDLGLRFEEIEYELHLLDLGVSPELLYPRAIPVAGATPWNFRGSEWGFRKTERSLSDMLSYLPRINALLEGSCYPDTPTVDRAEVLAVFRKYQARNSRIERQVHSYKIEPHPEDGQGIKNLITVYNSYLEWRQSEQIGPLLELPADTLLQMNYAGEADWTEGRDDINRDRITDGPALDLIRVGAWRDAFTTYLVDFINEVENALDLVRKVGICHRGCLDYFDSHFHPWEIEDEDAKESLDDSAPGFLSDDDYRLDNLQNIFERAFGYRYQFPEPEDLDLLIPDNGFGRNGWCPAHGPWMWNRFIRWSVVPSDEQTIQNIGEQQNLRRWSDKLRSIGIPRPVWDVKPLELLEKVERFKAFKEIIAMVQAIDPATFDRSVSSLGNSLCKKVGIPRKLFNGYWWKDKGTTEYDECMLASCIDRRALKKAVKEFLPGARLPSPVVVPPPETLRLLLSNPMSWRIISCAPAAKGIAVILGCDLPETKLRVEVTVQERLGKRKVFSATFYDANDVSRAPLIKSKFCSLFIFTLLEYQREMVTGALIPKKIDLDTSQGKIQGVNYFRFSNPDQS